MLRHFLLILFFSFAVLIGAEAAFFCAKAQSSRFDDGVLQARIEALIKAQIRLEQKDFASQSEFEMALAYFQNETAKLNQAVPGFVARYKQRFLELQQQILDQQNAIRRQKETAEQNRREVVRNARIFDPIKVREILHYSTVRSASFSPDGKFLVTGTGNSLARIIEVATGRILHEIEHGGWVDSARFSPDGTLVVTVSHDKKIRIIEVSTGQILREIPHYSSVLSASFSPDGKFIVTGSRDNKARIIAVAPGFINALKEKYAERWRPVVLAVKHRLKQVRYESKIDFKPITIANFSPDGKLLVTVSKSTYGTNGSQVQIIDVATGKALRRIHIHHPSSVRSAGFSPDGKFLVTGSGDRRARIFDVATGWELYTFSSDGIVESASFSPNSKVLVTAFYDQIQINDVATGKILHEFPHGIPHGSLVHSANISPDGKFLVTGSSDNKARIFQLYREIEE